MLPLDPGPLYAIDGDSGIKEEITYSIIFGKQPGLSHEYVLQTWSQKAYSDSQSVSERGSSFLNLCFRK